MSTQSEQILENALVDQLVELGYERIKVEDEASLLANLKTQLEAFNGVTLTEAEFGKVMNLSEPKGSNDEFRMVSCELSKPNGQPVPQQATSKQFNIQHSTFSTQHSTFEILLSYR